MNGRVKVKEARTGPEGSRKLRFADLVTTAHNARKRECENTKDRTVELISKIRLPVARIVFLHILSRSR